MRLMAFCVLALFACNAPAVANEFRVVNERSEFVALVANRDLTRLGVRLMVRADGAIGGSAFGRAVTGAWRWSGNFFCRELVFGQQELAANCQLVLVNGNTLRFVADQGAGDFADFRLR